MEAHQNARRLTEADVVAKYVGLVKWTAARRVPRRDYEDAVQDGLLGIVRAHRRFDGEPQWYDRWICLSIQRAIIDGHRTRTRSRRGHHGYCVSTETVIHDQYSGEPLLLRDILASGDTAEGAAVADDLKQWLRTLPFADPADRRVLDGMLDGMLLQDIAASEGVHPTRISQRVRKIRERLTEAL